MGEMEGRVLVIETKLDVYAKGFETFKHEVECDMRDINQTLKDIQTTTNDIKQSIARYLGIAMTLIAVAQLALQYFTK